MYDKMRVCTRCRGNGWDPDGGVCTVCKGAGALYREDGAPAKYEDADAFFDYYREMQDASVTRKYGG